MDAVDVAPDLKVLMAPVNISGMPLVLVRELRELGVDARLLQYTRGKQAHAYGYDSDILVDLNGRPTGLARFETLRNCLDDDYDIFHFWLRTLVFGPRYSGLMGADLPLIKLYGRKIVYRFTGMDLRDPKFDLEHNPYSPFRYGFVAAAPEDEPTRRAYVDYLGAYVDQFVVQDPELLQYKPEARVIPRALQLENWAHVGVAPTDRPLVVHGPSNPSVKGTKFVQQAVESLKEEGLDFDLKLVTGMAHEEAVAWYRRADIVIDQLLIGAYGVLTMEAMALGKPVICYVREDLFNPVFGAVPVINANPDTIKDRLRAAIKDYEMRREIGARGRAFVERHHDARLVATDLKRLYEDVRAMPSAPPTRTDALEFIGRQYGELEREATRSRALMRRSDRRHEDVIAALKETRADLREAQRGERRAEREAANALRRVEVLEENIERARRRNAGWSRRPYVVRLLRNLTRRISGCS